MKTETILVLLVIIGVVAGGIFYFVQRKNPTQPEEENIVLNDSSKSNDVTNSVTTMPAPKMEIDENKTYTAKMKTSEGEIIIELNAKEAPKTVNNFVVLAKKDFYDGLIFHRVIKGFMIQGGDPKGDGTGGPGYTVPAEIGLKHTRGAIAMARQSDQVNPKKESSGSQFYIAHADIPQLDGQYTVFGYVTEGLEVVDKIAEAEVTTSGFGESSKPVKPVKIESIEIVEI